MRTRLKPNAPLRGVDAGVSKGLSRSVKAFVVTKALHGNVRGKATELDEGLGAVDRQEVDVQVTLVKTKQRRPGPLPGWMKG
jgi:hypothetical protein